jgi:protein O-mannosyl-transferase
VLFLVGFFIINVLLVSNLFTIRDSFAERFVYIASLSGVIGIPLLFTWLEKHLEIRSLARIAMVILICSFMITTLHRNTFWESPLTLFQQEVKVNPMSSEAYFLLGNAYQGIGNNTMAVANYQKAISLNPNEFEAHMHLVNQYLGIGDIVTAHLHAKEMFRINSGDHKAPFYMGHTLALMKKYEEAEYYLRAAVLMKPQHGLYQQAYSEVRFLQNKTNAPVPTQ